MYYIRIEPDVYGENEVQQHTYTFTQILIHTYSTEMMTDESNEN